LYMSELTLVCRCQGIIEVNGNSPIGYLIDELEVVLGAGSPEDFENTIYYVSS
jgi:hypothetical protein